MTAHVHPSCPTCTCTATRRVPAERPADHLAAYTVTGANKRRCPVCGVASGEQCLSEEGVYSTRPHRPRSEP